MNAREIGLFQKFSVNRIDGQDAPGQKHFGDEYFVLNITTDCHAIPALAAYIASHVLEKSEYIIVPQMTLPNGKVVPSFQVGKYSSSRGPMGTPISIATAAPWVKINYHEAKDAAECNAMDLITETQALAIAWDISQQDINWTGGKVGEGVIYQGLHTGTVNEAQAGTYESTEPDERRWHQLSNGERIYDFAGNVFTWVFDDVQGDEGGLTGKIATDSISLQAPFPSMQKGMGWRPDGSRDWSGIALFRGGCWYSGSYAGVFDLYNVWPGYRGVYVGFR